MPNHTALDRLSEDERYACSTFVGSSPPPTLRANKCRRGEKRGFMTSPERDTSVSGMISRRAVKVLTEYTGRGPTKAHTVINRDSIMILLRDTLTKGERSLAASGMENDVLRTRQHYQHVMREDLIGVVEECSGRKVAAFMSGNHIDPDFAAEIFVLEPRDGGPRPYHPVESPEAPSE